MKQPRMSLSDLMTPDYIFNAFDDITPAFLSSLDIRALLIDIDNTLAPYEQPEPDDRIRGWFASLEANGIKAALISNNHTARVERFNRSLGLPAYPNSAKPRRRTLKKAMAEMGVSPEHTAGLGDQLFTDTLAVHRMGMLSLIVPPIKDKKSLFFKAKRRLEKPFIKRYWALRGGKESS